MVSMTFRWREMTSKCDHVSGCTHTSLENTHRCCTSQPRMASEALLAYLEHHFSCPQTRYNYIMMCLRKKMSMFRLWNHITSVKNPCKLTIKPEIPVMTNY